MKKLALMSLVLGTVLLARTETIELTGKYSEQLGNPFKKILNTDKSKKINIFSEDKDITLKVESNLNTENYLPTNQHPDTIVLKNKSVENVVEDFYIEDYIVGHSKNNAVVVNVESGTVSLNYTDFDNNQVQHLIGVEIKLLISINGVKKEVTMDQTLGAEDGENYDWVLTTDDFSVVTQKLKETISTIFETAIYSLLKGETK